MKRKCSDSNKGFALIQHLVAAHQKMLNRGKSGGDHIFVKFFYIPFPKRHTDSLTTFFVLAIRHFIKQPEDSL